MKSNRNERWLCFQCRLSDLGKWLQTQYATFCWIYFLCVLISYVLHCSARANRIMIQCFNVYMHSVAYLLIFCCYFGHVKIVLCLSFLKKSFCFCSHLLVMSHLANVKRPKSNKGMIKSMQLTCKLLFLSQWQS